ncbi:MAG TPA: filamentous hemagglutinin N-terminal domain-containing protein, partial [Myxococcota bacterium]|nr:filamentous hemagglutinin N-terminal domain-containing protein [Myxococcota bacterium]
MDFPRYAKRFLTLVLVDCMLLPSAALANPAGGVVHGGIATITGQGTSTVNVDQRSQNAMLSWQSFNIQPGEVTNFHQPNAKSVAINRILDGQASQILGGLNANGHVYLINPNGILFGHDSVVNVGSLTAAASVKAGDLLVFGNGFDASATAAPGAKIENQGTIRTQEGGFVYLVAPQVENGKSGVIISPKGEVTLAAGATVYLTDRADGLGVAIQYTAPGGSGDAAVNLGQVVADGGMVRMRADLVRQSGIIEATAVREQGGRIELVADSGLTLDDGSVTAATGGDGVGPGGTVVAKSEGDATVASASIIDVSGGSEGGAGGSVEVSGKGAVALSGTMRAEGHAGAAGGKVVV